MKICLRRWYEIPKCLSHIFKSLCWKGCNSPGSFKHCCWDCTPIKNFWCKSQTFIKDITGVALPFYPEIFLLPFWSDFQFRKHTKDIISVLITTAQLSIASGIPLKLSMKLWYKKVWGYFILAKLSDGLLQFDHPNYQFKSSLLQTVE